MRNPEHAMLPQPDAEDLARQRYVLALKGFIGRRLRPGNRDIYENVAKQDYAAEHGHEPADRKEIAAAMWANPQYQTFSALNRCAQEMLWEAVGETIFREQDRITNLYHELSESGERRGSLELDPEFEVPNAIRKINIHLQPGGYARDKASDDIIAGAYYEAGGALYSRGQSVGVGESKAECIMRFIARRYPDVKPRRILDMACSAGSSATPYALAFPDAEVHAIDVGPGLLRYAHARAEALGAAVHFHQRSADAPGFEDESFDLIVSHNAMHEISAKTTAGMMRESYRLLKPGGVCVHQDVPLRYSELDEFMRFERGWDLKNNNEPFWEAYATNDPEALLIAAGFAPESIFVGKAPQIDETISWFVAAARK